MASLPCLFMSTILNHMLSLRGRRMGVQRPVQVAYLFVMYHMLTIMVR